jgi:CBS domain-containing protein
MKGAKKVREIMDDIFDFPHLPYWFSVRQATDILKRTLPADNVCNYPRSILIFDERYNLLGSLNIRDILRGIEPKLQVPLVESDHPIEDDSSLASIAEGLYGDASVGLLDKPVSDFMTPARFFLSPDDPVTKAAYLMIHYNIISLPVLESRKKLIGMVRMVRVFDEIATALLAD